MTLFQCSLQLPINSPLKEVVTGPPEVSVELAKQAAAKEACAKLVQLKELDEYMIPTGKFHQTIVASSSKKYSPVLPKNRIVPTRHTV